MATDSEHEARRFSLSPEALYLDCFTRAFLRDHLDPSQLVSVCNIGIGLGAWDDWLGYWMHDAAALTSVDIDGDVVHRLHQRQAAEAHPKPAQVVHADLMQADLGAFDLVTIVGSTIHETHAPALALQTAQRWVKPGGWLYATILHGFADPDHLLTAVAGVTHRQAYTELPDAAFTAVLARSLTGRPSGLVRMGVQGSIRARPDRTTPSGTPSPSASDPCSAGDRAESAPGSRVDGGWQVAPPAR